MKTNNIFKAGLTLLFVAVSCSFFTCSEDTSLKEKKEVVSHGLIEPYKSPTSVKSALSLLFSQPCLIHTSKVDTYQKDERVVFYDEKFGLNQTIFENSHGNRFIFQSTTLTLDSLKRKISLHKENVKAYYLLDLRDEENEGLIEVYYPHSGSVYVLKSLKDGEKWSSLDIFCAKRH